MGRTCTVSRFPRLAARRWLVPAALLSTLLVAPFAWAQDGKTAQENAIAAIEKSGGRVLRDRSAPQPVVISVDLRETDITDADLASLSALSSVQELYLTGTPITDAGLVRLKGLAQLRKLTLGFTKVTDAGLVHLKGLTRLRVLGLQGTRTTNNGINTLQSQLPKLIVDRSDDQIRVRAPARPAPRP
jgi:hypothetical protein